tara:strand:+ start:4518 stop:4742 length:225 start_codon:yes stop_codon:yes gene_type:complete
MRLNRSEETATIGADFDMSVIVAMFTLFRMIFLAMGVVRVIVMICMLIVIFISMGVVRVIIVTSVLVVIGMLIV